MGGINLSIQEQNVIREELDLPGDAEITREHVQAFVNQSPFTDQDDKHSAGIVRDHFAQNPVPQIGNGQFGRLIPPIVINTLVVNFVQFWQQNLEVYEFTWLSHESTRMRNEFTRIVLKKHDCSYCCGAIRVDSGKNPV